MKPKIILLVFASVYSHSSTLFLPDSDTALMIQLVGTELEATAATLKILEVSSEGVKRAQEAHSYVEDKYTRGMQIEQYSSRIRNFPTELKNLKSMRDVRDVTWEGRSIVDEGGDYSGAYAQKIKNAEEINDSQINKIKNEKNLTNKIFKDSMDVKNTARGVAIGAKAASLNSSKLDDINQNLILQNSLLINKEKYRIRMEQEQTINEFNNRKIWGLIPMNMTLSEYLENKR